MAKRKNKTEVGVEEVTGTPSMVLLPARNFRFKVAKEEHSIVIPRDGKYFDIDPEFFSEEDGSFDLLSENNETLYMPSISKVLFATKKYPDLNSNQLFAPVVIRFNEDNVEIIGQVLEMLV